MFRSTKLLFEFKFAKSVFEFIFGTFALVSVLTIGDTVSYLYDRGLILGFILVLIFKFSPKFDKFEVFIPLIVLVSYP